MESQNTDRPDSRIEACEAAIEETDVSTYGSISKNQLPQKSHHSSRTPETKYLLRIGPAPNVARFQEEPRSYMTSSVLVAIFCFFPLGILAAFKSSQVHRRFTKGDLFGARKASQRSRMYFQGGFVIGIILWVLGILVLLTTIDKL